MSKNNFFLTGTLSLALAVTCFHTASAEALNADTSKSKRNYRKTKNGEGALTQKMLENCIELKAKIDKEFKKISSAKEEFETLNNEVIALSTTIETDKEQLDNQAEKAVNEHNEQVEQYNQKVEKLKKMEAEYNEESETYRQKTAQLEKECNSQSYYEDDYAAAVKKTGKTL